MCGILPPQSLQFYIAWILADKSNFIYYYYYYYYYLLLSCHRPVSPLYFPRTNGDPHRSGFQFQTAALPVFYVTFLVYLSFVLSLLNVCLVRFPNSSLNILLTFNYYYHHHHHRRRLLYAVYPHTYSPDSVPKGYIVAAILALLFMVPLSLVPAFALLFFYVSTSRTLCAVPNMAVFCSSLTSWLLLLLLLLFTIPVGNSKIPLSCTSVNPSKIVPPPEVPLRKIQFVVILMYSEDKL